MAARDLTRTGGAPASTKSLIASGVLSFFFGPLGWTYAGPMKEVLPSALLYLLVGAILPRFMLFYVVGPLMPFFALAGVLYAVSYNRNGRRMPLILKDPEPSKPRLGR